MEFREFPVLQLPQPALRFRNETGKPEVWDEFRKKWIIYTPEEHVRRHVLHYLQNFKAYPSGLIEVESQLEVNGRLKRFDILCRNRELKPVLLIECKAPDVELDDAVFRQVSQYNQALRVPYLMITNGLTHYVTELDFLTRQTRFLDELPAFTELI